MSSLTSLSSATCALATAATLPSLFSSPSSPSAPLEAATPSVESFNFACPPSLSTSARAVRRQASPDEVYDPPPFSLFPAVGQDEGEPTPTLSQLPYIPLTAAPVLSSSSSTTLLTPTGTSRGGGQAEPGTGTRAWEGRVSRATGVPSGVTWEEGAEGRGREEEEGREAKDGLERAKKEKRWEGWETSTSTVYVTNTDEVPTAVTVYTTYGESPVVDGGTVVETVYKGADTVTILGPSYLTLTFYPTTTTYSTSRVTVPTTTKTKTKTPAAQSTATVCAKGDADKKEFTGLKPTHDQSVTLYVIAIYIVGIAIGWNLFILRDLLYPFKYFTVAVHEMGHVLLTICLGFRIGYLEIDPKLGGLTRMAIGDEREHPIPFAALPIGYVFNIVWGGLLVFCGFDTLASKIASFIVGLCWIGVFLRVEIPAKIMTLGAVGLMIGLWFVDHAWGLRFYILFMGVMSSFYVLWDVADDAFFAKQNPCCPSLHFQAMPALGPGAWTAIYFVLSFVFFVGFILAGLATWKQDPHAMYCQAQTFLPTR